MRRPESREETPKEGDAVRIPHRNKIALHRTKVKPESGTLLYKLWAFIAILPIQFSAEQVIQAALR
ncbi:hypothetical protein IWQ49_003391 [Labrenzia sp. EL_126]|nr:hypothetical protein [Labrenzia sp. EL_126]